MAHHDAHGPFPGARRQCAGAPTAEIHEADARAAGIEEGWLYELAGLAAEDTPPDIDTLAPPPDAACKRIEMCDVAGGALRQARIEGGRLANCLMLTRSGLLPPRDWLVGLLAAETLGAEERRALLAGRAAEGGVKGEGRIVCACMGVRSGAILAAIADGARDAAAAGEKTGAGTNCGSCRAEIRGLIEKLERIEAA